MKCSSCRPFFRAAFFAIFCLSASFVSSSQVITTYAGNGTAGYMGDGAAATLAELNFPEGIAVDGSGSIYFTEYNNNIIRKVTAAGIISTIAGTGGTGGYGGDGGPATAAMLLNPHGLVFDATGNLYIADEGNNRVRKISVSGVMTTVAGNGTPAFSGDGGPATAASMYFPSGVAFDAAGNMYISDALNDRIRKVALTGAITTIAGSTAGFSGDGGPASDAHLDSPDGVYMDAAGNLFFADAANHAIRKINTAGIITTVAGNATYGYSGDGGAATAAQLSNPSGVAVNGIGFLYITDRGNNRVRMVNPYTGIITTLAGTTTAGYGGDGGPATAAELNAPQEIAVTSAGDIYISEIGNNRVRRVICNPPAIAPITGATSLCTGSTTSLADSTPGGGWTSTTPTVALAGTAGVISGVTTGAATISYSLASSCGTLGAASLLVTVNTIPSAGTIFGPDSVCRPWFVFFTDSISGGVWVSKHPSIATVTGTGRVTTIEIGSDSLWYIVSNSCGPDTATFGFRVDSSICEAAVNPVNNPQALSIVVFPNPGHGLFTLNLKAPEDGNALITITNVLGQKVKEWMAATNKETEFDLPCPPGIYFITAHIGNEYLTSKAVVE